MYSIIIPVYNESEVIKETYSRLITVLDKIDFELIFINDGSRDNTFEILHELSKQDMRIKILNFSRNFGHQIAVTAGLDYADGDAVIIIDADLQDPPEVILEMIEKWKEGYDVVYGKRIKRKGETVFKKLTARVFYKFLRSMTEVDVPENVGDFRLIDRKVCLEMRKIKEHNRYIRGLVSWVGFKQTAVHYVREERFAGVTKYPLRKMLKFSADAIASFSYKPLKIATWLGFLTSLFSFLFILYVLFEKLVLNNTIQGWASTIAVNLFFNGITLIIIGIIGEYIGRIYEELKDRPLYILKDKIGFSNPKGKDD